ASVLRDRQGGLHVDRNGRGRPRGRRWQLLSLVHLRDELAQRHVESERHRRLTGEALVAEDTVLDRHQVEERVPIPRLVGREHEELLTDRRDRRADRLLIEATGDTAELGEENL